jgi:hypothetical protein
MKFFKNLVQRLQSTVEKKETKTQLVKKENEVVITKKKFSDMIENIGQLTYMMEEQRKENIEVRNEFREAREENRELRKKIEDVSKLLMRQEIRDVKAQEKKPLSKQEQDFFELVQKEDVRDPKDLAEKLKKDVAYMRVLHSKIKAKGHSIKSLIRKDFWGKVDPK